MTSCRKEFYVSRGKLFLSFFPGVKLFFDVTLTTFFGPGAHYSGLEMSFGKLKVLFRIDFLKFLH